MIFFDIDGTLIDHASASAAASLIFYDQYCGQIPFSREEFPGEYERILNKHFDRYSRGEISMWEQRRERMREIFGCPGLSDAEADERYGRLIREYEPQTRAYGDAAPCLERLAGEPLGIISNGAREQQIGKLERAGLLQYFSVMVYSEDVGLGKPDASIFMEACRRAGESPACCTHVGDNVEADVVPSRRLGMNGIWLDRNGSQRIGPPVINTLTEIPALLQMAIETK
jgi:putative hydrolase of the HAD superfamily